MWSLRCSVSHAHCDAPAMGDRQSTRASGDSTSSMPTAVSSAGDPTGFTGVRGASHCVAPCATPATAQGFNDAVVRQ